MKDIETSEKNLKIEKDKSYQIQIDRKHYTVTQGSLSGAQLRSTAEPPIDPDRDLFEVVPGGTDKKIDVDDVVDIRNGLRFFTAPGQINPGVVCDYEDKHAASKRF